MQYFDALTYRDDDVVRTVLISIWAAAEPCRIAAGFFGNLQEHVRLLCCRVLCRLVSTNPIILLPAYEQLAHLHQTALTFALVLLGASLAAALVDRVRHPDDGATPRDHLLHAGVCSGAQCPPQTQSELLLT